MKKTTILFLNLLLGSAIVLFFASCDKLKELTKADVAMQMAELNFTIQPKAAGTHTLAEFDAYLNVDSIIKGNASSFNVNNIKSVKLVSCNLEMLNGGGPTSFGILSAFKTQLSSNSQPGLVTIAEISDHPDLDLNTLYVAGSSSVELKNYFKASHFSYKISGTLRRDISNALNCRATLKFNVQVGL